MSWPGVTPVTDSLMWWMPRQKECVQRGEVNTGSAGATSRSDGAGARKTVRTKEEERSKVRLTQLNAWLRLPLTQLGVVYWPINLRRKTLFGVSYLHLCWAPIKNRQICHLGRWLKQLNCALCGLKYLSTSLNFLLTSTFYFIFMPLWYRADFIQLWSKFWYFIELKKNKNTAVSLWSLPCWLLWLPPSSCQDLSHMWQAFKKPPQGGLKFLHRRVVNTVSANFQPGSAEENWASCMANTILIILWMILLDHILVRFSRKAAILLTFFKSTDWLVIANSLDRHNSPPFAMLVGHELSCGCAYFCKRKY